MYTLTFLCSQLFLLPGSEAISLCCAIAGHGTWHPQHPGMQESIWERGGEKAAANREPPPAADFTGMIPHALARDCAFLKAGNALISCHPYTPELPHQVVYQ